MTINTQIQLIRRPLVLALTARSKSALFLDEQSGLMPPAISIGDRAVAYLQHEIEAVIQARIEGKTNEQIKALVQELIEHRKQVA
ncbi:AlpA family transcriptional regulator [Thalassotalea sp. PP2-459]|uniref:helix-turn-helix transcriptional regulator n=1 Tax=Thalassotalea sp. PP2-459 TaxID=1742724 RepID=UPI0009423384|nr:AlpA family phage regulatory protein [Thalassotalea sp. PP2-459]OKY27658.1 transcriptional regulator [Thalassotalea sp. PP2-459]